MALHTSVDIETLGLKVGSVILSIGAVRHDAHRVYDRFYTAIDIQSCLDIGLRVEGGTIALWFSDKWSAARDIWNRSEKTDITTALHGFADWYASIPGDMPVNPAPERGKVWGNGSMFDNSLLKAACGAAGVEYPVFYRDDACYRTLKNLAPDVPIPVVGTLHHALDDAESQAMHLMAVAERLGLAL